MNKQRTLSPNNHMGKRTGLIAIFLAASMISISNAQADEVLKSGAGFDGNPLKVVTDTNISSALVRNLADNFVSVQALVPTGVNPSDYELTESDRELIKNAEFIVYQGLDSMPEFEELASQRPETDRVALGPAPPHFRLIKRDDGSINPYTYLSPALWQDSVDALARGLKRHLDHSAGRIEGNRLRVNIELQSLERETSGSVGELSRAQRLLISDNDAFAYFAQHFNFQLFDITDPEQSEKAIELINQQKTPHVFQVEQLGDGAIERWLEEHRGNALPENIELAEPLKAVSLGEDITATANYTGWFRQNVTRIIHGLQPLPEAADTVETPGAQRFTP
ncbi:MAG TPA: hypothetical protein ENM98_03680 [Halothiobacillaceae bacterium]|nr:hypothetical protein [Halothiobacillaceae bacterium]